MHDILKRTPIAGTPLLVREANARELDRWDDLLARFSNHRVTQTAAWIRSLEDSVGAKPLFLLFEKHGEIVGCFPGLLTRVGPFRLFGSPLAGWQTSSMGPAFDSGRTSAGEMMRAAVELLERRYHVHHIELVNRDLDAGEMEPLGFRGEPVATFRAPLCPDNPDKTLRQLKDSARRNIRRAAKLGLQVRVEDDERFVDEAYDQIQEVFIRGGNIVPFKKARVREFVRHMKASGSLVAVSVYLGDVNIATGTFTIHGDELLLWQWAHRTEHRWYRPTELMTWTAMQRAMQAGCTTFDLMGRGSFKEKFGAGLDERQRRWIRSRHQWITTLRSIAGTTYKWQQSVRGRMKRRGLPEPVDTVDSVETERG